MLKTLKNRIFATSPQGQATWNYHLWASLFFFMTISSFGWDTTYLWRPLYLTQRYPMHLLANWLLAFSISYFVALFIRHKKIHFWSITVFCLMFAAVSREKFEALGLPLLAVDLSLGKYSDVLVEYFTVGNIALFLFGLAIPFAALTIHRKGKKSCHQLLATYPKFVVFEYKTILIVLLTLPIWSGLYFSGAFVFGGVALDVRAHTPDTDYLGNGDIVSFTLSFYSNRNVIKKYKIRPELMQALDAQNPSHLIDPSCQTTTKPDILVVMVESMFDPVQIPKVEFSQDPLAPLRSMGYQENKSFFFVPSYGGATANTEFEFLTGSTHRFFPFGTVQYQHHVFSPANSLARMLKDKNYHTMAVHNYRREFWRRHEVYPLLGFEEFYGLEDIQKNITVDLYNNGKKPQDKALARFVPDQMKKHQNEAGFYFVVTMGTHGPYQKYLLDNKSQIKLETTTDIQDRSKRLLTNYTNFLADSSNALSDLFRFALGRSKPTVVVFFGDHLPGLPFEMYQKTGFFEWMKKEIGLASDVHKVVPIRVLNNFGCQFEIPKTIASNCMATHLISQLYPDLPKDQFWKFNQQFCKKTPFIFDGINANKLTGDMADYASLIYQSLFNWKSRAQ